MPVASKRPSKRAENPTIPRLRSGPVPVVEAPETGSELAVDGAVGRAPTQDELRNLVWKFVTMEDVRQVVQNIIELAKDGQPTAMGIAVRLLGLDVEGDNRQKSPAEGILEKIRDILALQKFPTQLNLNVSAEELYGDIIEGRASESAAPEPWYSLGSPSDGKSGHVPGAQIPPNATSAENPL